MQSPGLNQCHLVKSIHSVWYDRILLRTVGKRRYLMRFFTNLVPLRLELSESASLGDSYHVRRVRLNLMTLVQPFGFPVTESAHSKCLRSTPVGAGQTSPGRLAPCGEGQIPWLYLHILTDFAVNAKSWAELLPQFSCQSDSILVLQ